MLLSENLGTPAQPVGMTGCHVHLVGFCWVRVPSSSSALARGPEPVTHRSPDSHQGPAEAGKVLGESSFSSLLTLSISCSPSISDISWENVRLSFLQFLGEHELRANWRTFCSSCQHLLDSFRTLCGEVSCSQSLRHFTSLDPEKSHDLEFSSLYV